MRVFQTLCVALVFSALLAYGQDWPAWRGINRDGVVVAGVPVPDKLPENPKVIWRAPIGGGFSSPVVAAGTLFFCDSLNKKDIVHAVNASNGNEIWQAPIDDSCENTMGTGPRCPPLVDGELLYVESAAGEFQCRTAIDGKLVWRKNFLADFGAVKPSEQGTGIGASRHGYAASPLIDGDNILVMAGAKGASVVCLNKKTGAVIWKSQDDTAGYSSPIIATLAGVRQAVIFTAIAAIGLNLSDGKPLWRVPLKTGAGRHVATPLAIGDMAVLSSHQVGLTGIKIEKSASGLNAVQVWQNKEAAVNFSSPVAVGNYVYCVGQASKVFCADARTGEMKWAENGVVTSSVDRAYGAFMVMGSNILVLTDTGDLVLIAVNENELKQLGRVHVCGANWCNPAYADGKLYLRDAKEIMCVDLLSK